MRILWYWPFIRTEEMDWAQGTVRPGDRLVVQTIDRPDAPPAGTCGQVTVVRDLPDVDRGAGGGLPWLLSRADTYLGRESARRQQWRHGRPDLVHVHYVNRFTDAVAPLPRPLVMSAHDVVPHLARLGNHAESALIGRTYRRADAVVVHHRWLGEQLQAVHGVPSARIHVVPHQVYPVAQPVPHPAAPPAVLFFGTLRPNKGLETLAAALPLLRGDISVVVAGRGDAGQEALARSMAATDPRVRLEIARVSLERKRELFAEASVVVLPYTTFASQSGVLHDAYGHGRPVVVTDVGALGHSVRAEGTGRVIPVGDARALAAALHDVLEPSAWQQASTAAIDVARARTPQVVGALLRDVYDVVLGH